MALSSTEAEYISKTCKETIYLRNLLQKLTGNLYCINLFIIRAHRNCLLILCIIKRSKHIDVRHHFIREAISNKLIKVEYLLSTDILTKGLNSKKHYKFLNMLGISIMQHLR